MAAFEFASAVRWLWRAVHGLSATLLAHALIAAVEAGREGVAVGGVLLGALYVAGPMGRSEAGGPAFERVWLVVVTLGWVVLAALCPQFVWLAFPLFFAFLHVLPLWAAMFGVAVLACVAVVAGGLHAGELSAPLVVGPAAGAVAAALMSAEPVTGSRSRKRASARPAPPPGA